jgi:hypothetical protein
MQEVNLRSTANVMRPTSLHPAPQVLRHRLMPSPAKVRSVDAIEGFRVQLAKYEQQIQDALESLNSELHRAETWLKRDRPSYWKQQTKLAEDAVHQAKLDLQRCIMFPVAGERPACREERAVLKQAQVRLEYCHEKTERVRYWNRQLQHEMLEFAGRIGQLKRIMETELPAARARLQQVVRRLDAYQIERAPLSHDSTAHDSTAHDSTAHDSTAHDSTAHDSTAHDSTARDLTARDLTAHDSTARAPETVSAPAETSDPQPGMEGRNDA